MAINFPAEPQSNDIYTEGGVSWQYDGTVWNLVGASATVDIPNGFSSVSVAGQDDIVADSTNDTLTFVAGSNVTITTDATNDRLEISSTGGGGGDVTQNLYETVTGDTGTTTASSATDTLNIVGGTGITTTVTNDTVTIASSVSQGGSNFSELQDANRAALTIDKTYLQAITRLAVDNSGASAYTFDQYSGNNPTIYAISGTTIAFDLDEISGHPFLIQDGSGTAYNTGLVHVSTTGVVSTGQSAQGQEAGTLYWKIPQGLSGNYRYQCSVHSVMVGLITLKNITTI